MSTFKDNEAWVTRGEKLIVTCSSCPLALFTADDAYHWAKDLKFRAEISHGHCLGERLRRSRRGRSFMTDWRHLQAVDLLVVGDLEVGALESSAMREVLQLLDARDGATLVTSASSPIDWTRAVYATSKNAELLQRFFDRAVIHHAQQYVEVA